MTVPSCDTCRMSFIQGLSGLTNGTLSTMNSVFYKVLIKEQWNIKQSVSTSIIS